MYYFTVLRYYVFLAKMVPGAQAGRAGRSGRAVPVRAAGAVGPVQRQRSPVGRAGSSRWRY